MPSVEVSVEVPFLLQIVNGFDPLRDFALVLTLGRFTALNTNRFTLGGNELERASPDLTAELIEVSEVERLL